MMELIENLKNKSIEIYADEWLEPNTKGKFFRITLFNFLHTHITKIKSWEYYCFNGQFEKNYEEFAVKKQTPVLFWIPNKSFEKEIVKHINVSEISKTDQMDITLDFCRSSLKKIKMANVTINAFCPSVMCDDT